MSMALAFAASRHFLGHQRGLWSYGRFRGCRGPKLLHVKSLWDRVGGEGDLEKDSKFSSQKEQSRKYRRTVFTFDDWARHRSTGRYWNHIKGIFVSRIALGLAQPLAAVMGVGAGVCIYEEIRLRGILIPMDWPSMSDAPTMPLTFTSFALALLLVFRTNSSYSRWKDARKAWGGLLNRTRDITRQAVTWFSPADTELTAMLVRWVIAFPKALMCHLRIENNLEEELQNVLAPDELQALLRANHRPNYVLTVISGLISRGGLSNIHVYRMDENLTFLADVVGTCERILKAPIPLSYTRHTSRFLTIWLAFLPGALYSTCGWATVPASGIIAFLLLGIEEIGVSVEEPFSILPLAVIANVCEENVREIAESGSGVQDLINLKLGQEPLPTLNGQDDAWLKRNGSDR